MKYVKEDVRVETFEAPSYIAFAPYVHPLCSFPRESPCTANESAMFEIKESWDLNRTDISKLKRKKKGKEDGK